MTLLQCFIESVKFCTSLHSLLGVRLLTFSYTLAYFHCRSYEFLNSPSSDIFGHQVNGINVGLGGLRVTCSPRDPRFAGSNPTEVDGVFQDVRILSTSPPGGSFSWGSRVWDFRLVKEPQAWKNKPLSHTSQLDFCNWLAVERRDNAIIITLCEV